MGRILVTAVVMILAFTNALPGKANELSEAKSQVTPFSVDSEQPVPGVVKLCGQELADLNAEAAGGLFTEELKALNAAGLSEEEISALSAVEALKMIGAYYCFNQEFSKARPYFRLTLDLLNAKSRNGEAGAIHEDIRVSTSMIQYLDRMIAK